ncbi:uncharacterized protein LOC132721626 [Ruditapes philippinarum]|uniref:uncharacterized protein LOC132721626 n=1 Tax=Ruditapes philippinarum TaxID=129788 RepID=UPI00295A633A|nr:uncharacterized protein LOC132721626 [Ruditapes philippinarum]
MERKTLSKSAPSIGRRNSVKKDKSTTIKEINSWINKGESDNLPRKSARGVNNLTENVTEERMLYSRQLELGRERYKFLTNHEYEKQKFVERQNNKDKMMKQFMASARKVIEKTHAERPKKVLTIRVPQMDEISSCESPVGEDPISRPGSRASRLSSKVDKKKVSSDDAGRSDSRTSRTSRQSTVLNLNKYATRQSNKATSQKSSTNYKGTIKSAVKRGENSNGRTKCANIPSDKTKLPNRGVYVNTSSSTVHKYDVDDIKTEFRFPSVNGSNSKSASPEKSRSSSPTKSVRYASLPSGPIKSSANTDSVTPKWVESPRFFGKFGEKFDTSINDPRYVALTNTLMKVDDMKMPQIGVREIIENNEVLRKASKTDNAVHAKQMHAKFIAFLLENEFK